MAYDQYGRPLQPVSPQYGYTAVTGAPGVADDAVTGGPSARTVMPTVGQLGGQGQVPWVRFPFFPTSPFYSTNPNVGHQIRYYSTGITGTQNDVSLGSETIRVIQFDIPCRIVAINASAAPTSTDALALAPWNLSMDPRDLFLFRLEYTTGDRLHITSRLASTVTGTGQRPSELGGTGYTVDQGAGLIIGITPLASLGNISDWRIDITLHALEVRGSSNFVGGR
jgi:hypothetical protein